MRRNCYGGNDTHSTFLNQNYNENDTWCPRIFDGFACWDKTPAATTAFQPCPNYIVGFDPKRLVYKKCTDNGSWLVNPETNKPWTNYTTCVDVKDLNFRTFINIAYVGGYSISVAALMLSIMIFLSFTSLQCIRTKIHVHLFTSFALNNILWIVWYHAVINSFTVLQENMEWCQILHILTNYFMITSYTWMFCEGLYLHIALVVVFVKDELALRWFKALGWGLSFIIVMAYASARYYIGDTERCWIDKSEAFWVIKTPVLISLLTSFVFMLNVVRILLTKAHLAPNQPTCVTIKKAARATLILIPLFGLHFILIPLQPLPNSPGEKVYQIIAAPLTSLQGLCVAILFCFANQDVIIAANRYILRYRRTNEALAMTGNTYPLTGFNRV